MLTLTSAYITKVQLSVLALAFQLTVEDRFLVGFELNSAFLVAMDLLQKKSLAVRDRGSLVWLNLRLRVDFFIRA